MAVILNNPFDHILVEMETQKERRSSPRDEALYNKLQEHEIPLFVLCAPPAVLAILDKKSLWCGTGRPPCSLYDILISLLFKQYFRLSLRRAIGLLNLLKNVGCLDIKIHCFKTLDNYLLSGEVEPYIHRLVEITSVLFRIVERFMATDSTGTSTTCFSSWYSIRVCKKSRKRDHLMVHISVGTKSHVVVALDVRSKQGSDNEIFRSHVKRVDKNFNVEEWSGDSAYLSRKNCDAVVEIGAEPWFRLKSNTTAKPKGSVAFKNMVLKTKNNPEEADEKYHRRSNIECTNSAKKRKFGSSVRCRVPIAQRNEDTLSWIGYNFSLLPKAPHEYGIKINFGSFCDIAG